MAINVIICVSGSLYAVCMFVCECACMCLCVYVCERQHSACVDSDYTIHRSLFSVSPRYLSYYSQISQFDTWNVLHTSDQYIYSTVMSSLLYLFCLFMSHFSDAAIVYVRQAQGVHVVSPYKLKLLIAIFCGLTVLVLFQSQFQSSPVA